MADAKSLFQVVIEAVDRLSVPFEKMSAKVHAFNAPIREVGERLEHLGEVAGIERIGERFHVLSERIGETAERLGEFVGPFALLAGVGSAAGLIELANKVSESGEHIHDTAIKIGIDAESLQKLEFGAKLNSVPAETLEKALTKLNRVVAEAAAGKNKNAAQMFSHLGIRLRDAKGHVLDAAQVFPKLADAIKRNENPAIRTRIAVTAFSKAGAELIPFLEKGSGALSKYGEEAEKTGILTNEQVKQSKEFADKSAVLRASIEGVANAIGAALMPVLEPVIVSVTKWVQANRDLIATKVEHAVKVLGEAIKKIDWERLYDGLKDTAKFFGRLLGSTRRLEIALGVLGAVMVGPFLASIVSIGTALVSLAASTIPLVIGAFVGLGAVIEATPVGWILTGIALIGAAGYELYQHWDKVKEFFIHLWDNTAFVRTDIVTAAVDLFRTAGAALSTAWSGVRDDFVSIWDGISGAFEAAWRRIKPIVDAIFDNRIARFLDGAAERIGNIGGVPLASFGQGPGEGALFGQAGPQTRYDKGILGLLPPSGRVDGEVHVKVDLSGAPQGTRVSTQSRGQVKSDINVGWNMRTAPAY